MRYHQTTTIHIGKKNRMCATLCKRTNLLSATNLVLLLCRHFTTSVYAESVLPQTKSESIELPQPKSKNIGWMEGQVQPEHRVAMKKRDHTGLTVWMTGYSGSGKTTIAVAVEKKLIAAGVNTYRLDGDNLRFGLNRDLGFTTADRTENNRRVAEVARLMSDAGLVVICSLISPLKKDREVAREVHAARDAKGGSMPKLPFLEVFVEASLAAVEKRDPKGLYKKARAGQIPGFTGIDAPYEPPENADLTLNTEENTLDVVSDILVEEIMEKASVSARYVGDAATCDSGIALDVTSGGDIGPLPTGTKFKTGRALDAAEDEVSKR